MAKDKNKITSLTFEYTDPFERRNVEFWIKAEHWGRYVWAHKFLQQVQPQTHLDIGCAAGYGVAELSSVAAKVIGVDYDGAALKIARSQAPQGEFIELDFDKQKLTDAVGQVDSVTAFEVMEHLDNPAQFMTEVSKVLRVGGWLLLSVPNPKYEFILANGKPAVSWHHHVFTPQDIAQLAAAAGLEVQQILGQPLVNKIARAELKLKKLLKLRTRPSCAKWLQQNWVISLGTKLFCLPKTGDIEHSYSFIYVLKKTNRQH